MTRRRGSRGRGPAHKRPPRTHKPEEKSRWYRALGPLVSPTGRFWAFVLLLLALVGAYFQFKPKVSLEAEPPLKIESDINIPFRVTNESLLPIYNIKQEWTDINYRLEDATGASFETDNVGLGLASDEETIPKLGSGQSATVYPFRNFGHENMRITHMAFTVIIIYDTVVRRGRKARFGFEAKEGADGILHWYHTLPSR